MRNYGQSGLHGLVWMVVAKTRMDPELAFDSHDAENNATA